MKLTLRNLGRLREATIDLSKDLIVLTGPNNTSKTYVAHAVYGLCTYFPGNIFIVLGDAFKDPLVGRWEGQRYCVDLLALVERHLPRLLEQSTQRYRSQLTEILAAQEGFIAQTQVLLESQEARLAEAKRLLRDLEVEETLRGTSEDVYRVRKVAGDSVWTYERVSPSLQGPETRAQSEALAWTLVLLAATQHLVRLISQDVMQLPLHPYILTAERAAIQLFSRELSRNRSELVDSLAELRSILGASPEAGEKILETVEQQTRRYPLAIRRSLSIANDLAQYRKQSSPLASLADEMEGKVLGGSTHVDADGEMSFKPEKSDASLSLHLSSSSVKSLAGLSFFLRHIAGQQKFLIIDEPELNLHPDNQRRVARVLARIVRSGIKVLISTHSDYLIRELNNLIMLSADTDGSVRQRLGYGEQETLVPSQVGAYLFGPERAEPIDVKPTGIEVATIDREINGLNKDSQDIYFSLFGDTDA